MSEPTTRNEIRDQLLGILQRLEQPTIDSPALEREESALRAAVCDHMGQESFQIVTELRQGWTTRWNQEVAVRIEKVGLCRAMCDRLDAWHQLKLPSGVCRLILERFSDYAAQFESDDEWLNDASLRLHRICFLNWIPLGVYDFEYSSIPRSNILKCPWSQKPQLLNYLCFHMKGLGPTVEMHLPPLKNQRFTKEASDQSHQLMAEVVRLQPEIKGISGSSWYCDPKALEISPHLAFVRELFCQNGGFVHKLGPTSGASRKALLKSERRRRMYEQGSYVPTDYARYWARDALIEWSTEFET